MNSVKIPVFPHRQRAGGKQVRRQQRSKTWSCNNSVVNVGTVHVGARTFLKNNSDKLPFAALQIQQPPRTQGDEFCGAAKAR